MSIIYSTVSFRPSEIIRVFFFSLPSQRHAPPAVTLTTKTKRGGCRLENVATRTAGLLVQFTSQRNNNKKVLVVEQVNGGVAE